MKIFNQYSAVVLALAVLIGLAYALLRRGLDWRAALGLGAVALGLVLAWAFLRPVRSAGLDEAAGVRARIGSGTPVLLEFQSPY